jgi:hypothetical protein
MPKISEWLEKLGMPEYAQHFAENDIDFLILGDLTDQDLEKIGIKSLGHRRKILRSIAELGDSGKAIQRAPVSAETTPPAMPRDMAERRQAGDVFGPRRFDGNVGAHGP